MAKQKTVGKHASNGNTKPVMSGAKFLNMAAVGGALALLMAIITWGPSMQNAGATEITVYKSPTCGCCRKWVDHLHDSGFNVTTKERQNMDEIKSTYGVKSSLKSCHTAVVDGYVVEGHAPAADIKRLLEERPQVVGLAVPGMPADSPGMDGHTGNPYDVLTFDKAGKTEVYASY